jgi:hypothetical protein
MTTAKTGSSKGHYSSTDPDDFIPLRESAQGGIVRVEHGGSLNPR